MITCFDDAKLAHDKTRSHIYNKLNPNLQFINTIAISLVVYR